MSESQSYAKLGPELAQRVETVLNTWLPKTELSPSNLHQAMRYSSLNAGKRIRPLLVYATGLCTGQDLTELDGPAAAIELIHVYSLIHDDLPCMDDDELRRGKPTCHIVYGDATATLAGDALQALAFEIIVTDPKMQSDNAVRVAMMKNIAVAAGSLGMAGGQAIDLAATDAKLSLHELENMHALKTGRLISACIEVACANQPTLAAEQYTALTQYGKNIGLAFQVRDDIIDITSDTETLGKSAGSDQNLNKATFPSTIGLEASIEKAQELQQSAMRALEIFGSEASLLRGIAEFIVSRQH